MTGRGGGLAMALLLALLGACSAAPPVQRDGGLPRGTALPPPGLTLRPGAG